jgi:hypothetical protein
MNYKLSIQLFLCLLMLVLYGCSNSKQDPLFRQLSPDKSGVRFTNSLTYSDSLTVLEFEYMFNGAGVALIDINNDSLQDIIFTGNMVSCKLFLNKGNLRFQDISEQAGVLTEGWCYGVSVVDINQDGFQDFYICKAGNRKTPADKMRNLFFINNGNNTFTESAAKMGLDDDGYDIQAAFLDYDRDGDLDMYLLRNAFVDYNRNNTRTKELTGKAKSTDKLYCNNGNDTFSDVSKSAGITIEGFGLGINVCDVNNDNLPDIYVSNDFLTNDLLWINNGNGSFTNKAGQYLQHESYNGMGNDVADFNNDGLQDIMVVDMLPPDNKRWKLTMMGNTYDEFQQNIHYGYEPQYVRNTLQLNNGNGSFSEIGQLAGVHATEWSWAPLFADFDNNGWKDLFISNGYRQDVTNLDFIMYGKRALYMGTAEANRKERLEELNKMPGVQVRNYFFKNNQDLTFKDCSEEWGMTAPDYSSGAAYGDLDNDGDLDLVINNLDQPAAVYENQSDRLHPEKSWLRIRLNGPAGNQDGIGASVRIWQHGMMQHVYCSPIRGYLSSVESVLHFGTQPGRIDSVQVVWPDGSQQQLNAVGSRQTITLDHSNASAPAFNIAECLPLTFTPANAACGVHYQHTEDEFVDFKIQPLLPHMHSRDGPAVAVGDVNKDGLDDFFAGAAAGYHAKIYLQQSNGKFLEHSIAEENLTDNMGALFFDAENDGDLDLYIASGGTTVRKRTDSIYQHRLYINDGKGNFQLLPGGLPGVITPASNVTAADYDRDGDLDLFISGRVSSGEYPISPRSFLLRNDASNQQCRFTDVTSKIGCDLTSIGMVSTSLWTDFDNDGWTDLVVAGEFMPVRFYKNHEGTFTEVTNQTGLDHTAGWWNSITGGDFDKDGDIDYILGNLGLNGPYKASTKEPVRIYAADYDKNGRLDPIMCHCIGDTEYIVHARDDINRQMTAMRGRFRNYEAYASVTMKQAFRVDELDGAYSVTAERFENSYLENKGNGKFALRALPLTAQFAPIYGTLCKDFDGDGNLDVACVGNSFATEVQTGRYDAQPSLILRGDGKGNFHPDRRGLGINGDNKSIAFLNWKKGYSLLVVGSNSGELKLVSMHQQNKLLALQPFDKYAIIIEKDGNSWRQEFYYGHSYLSQESRRFILPPSAKQVIVYDSFGKKRTIDL